MIDLSPQLHILFDAYNVLNESESGIAWNGMPQSSSFSMIIAFLIT